MRKSALLLLLMRSPRGDAAFPAAATIPGGGDLRDGVRRWWRWTAVLWAAAVAAPAAAVADFDPSDTASWLVPEADLYDVDAHGDMAWAVGYWGTVLRSADRGKSWSHVSTPTDAALYAVSFANESDGWAVGAKGALLRTTDGGLTWEALRASVVDAFEGERPLDSPLFDVSAVSSHEAWVVGDFGVILHTLNGRDWRQVVISEETFADDNLPDRIFNAVHFIDRSHGWIAGEFGTVLRTADAGKTWVGERVLHGAVSDVYLMDIAANADGTAVAGGIGGVVIETSDGGATWYTAEIATRAGLFGTARLDSRAIMVGDRGVIFISRDGGKTWSEPKRPRLFNWLRGSAFGPGGFAYIVGEHGLVLLSEDAGESWARSAGHEPPPLEGISVPDPARTTEPGREDTDRNRH